MPKPLIGITAPKKGNPIPTLAIKFMLWRHGSRSLIIKDLEDSYKKCQAFVIAGGADINPNIYGQKNTNSEKIDPKRDRLEITIINHALAENKPMLGICRGMQMINIVHGGTLHQDARLHFDEFLPSKTVLGKIFGRRRVFLNKNSTIKKTLQKSPSKVNSIHHQSIAKTGENLKVTATDKHNIPQTLENATEEQPPILAVQWHPELMLFNKKQHQIFKHLISTTVNNLK